MSSHARNWPFCFLLVITCNCWIALFESYYKNVVMIHNVQLQYWVIIPRFTNNHKFIHVKCFLIFCKY